MRKGRLEKKPSKPVWKTPSDLKKGDYLIFPIPKETRDLDFYEQEVEIGQPSSGKRLTRKLRMSAEPDLFRLIGYYLAEGYIVKRTVGFAFCDHETEYIEDTARLLEKFFGQTTERAAVPQRTHVLLHSVTAVQFFEKFGEGNSDKKLPDWVMFAPPFKQEEAILGAWRVDGYFHKPTKGNRASFWEYVTTSKALAFQLQQLLFRSGIVGQIASTQYENREQAFVVTVRGNYVSKMSQLMRVKFDDSRTKTFSRFEMDIDYVYSPIRDISSVQVHDQQVVNLSVEGNESYVAGNVTAHNCTDYCPEYALEETVEYDIAEYTRELLVWSPERLAKPPVKKGDKYVFSVDTSRGAGPVAKREN